MKPVPKSAVIVGVIGLLLFIFFYGFIALGGVLLMAFAGWLWFKDDTAAPKAEAKAELDYRAIIEPLKFKHIGKHNGIGLDPDNKVLHLYQNKQYRAYPFGEIRNWSANIQSGGEMVGGHGNLAAALSVTAANTRNSRANAAATGFFVEVRDIDFPKWKIDFPPKGQQQSHDRWMETFRQYVNES